MGFIKQMVAYDCQGPPRDRANRKRIIFWAFPWAVAWVLSTLAVKFEWTTSKPIISTCALVTFVLGTGFILAYRRYIGQADELVRKVELEALSFALGAVLVGGVTYQILASVNIIEFGDVFSISTMLASFSYLLGIFWGYRRYQ